jgi:hypothetical protein
MWLKHTKPIFCQSKAMIFLLILIVALVNAAAKADYQPIQGPLMTRWSKHVSVGNVHEDYPRPQLVRRHWLSLNGIWQYAIRPKDETQPQEFDGQILVPFPIESALSGVMKSVSEENYLWYRRTFRVPKRWLETPRPPLLAFPQPVPKRILLHFGAVDWQACVWINGHKLGSHRGGYDPFTFDITDALNDTGTQEIVVSVWDPTDTGFQPRGKQVRKPHGIWYTAVTGIWQTVWLEPVPEAYISSLKIIEDIDSETVRIIARCSENAAGYTLEAFASKGWFTGYEGEAPVGEQIELTIKNPKLWSPDSPSLYDLKVTLKNEQGRKIDSVSSYFGMRKISLGKDEKGTTRLFLNNKPLFQFGPLDQGWWPDGLYTAPTDKALRYDIEVIKKLGCNMVRKHVKVEQDRFYYWCDKLGLMIWQDMPNGDMFIGENEPDLKRSEDSARQFELELTQIIESLRNHPSIVMWVPFNEGWGQYNTPQIVEMIKQLEPTRLVNNASGWADRGVGDVHDIHSYPGPAAPPVEENRAAVLGEFGGLGLPVKGHLWQEEKNWGYRTYQTREELTQAYIRSIGSLRQLIDEGLSAAVYTQTTDIEIEVNGLMTYDRALIKMGIDKVAAANRRLYLPPPVVKAVVPTSQSEGQKWKYTTIEPAAGWEQPDFNDSNWPVSEGGFGTETTPGSVVRTKWNKSNIWLRREFQLPKALLQEWKSRGAIFGLNFLSQTDKLSRVCLLIHHDEDAEVYINGRLVANLKGYTTNYVLVELDDEAIAALKPGPNCLAAHCQQTTGGQYVDVGLVEVIETGKE